MKTGELLQSISGDVATQERRSLAPRNATGALIDRDRRHTFHLGETGDPRSMPKITGLGIFYDPGHVGAMQKPCERSDAPCLPIAFID